MKSRIDSDQPSRASPDLPAILHARESSEMDLAGVPNEVSPLEGVCSCVRRKHGPLANPAFRPRFSRPSRSNDPCAPSIICSPMSLLEFSGRPGSAGAAVLAQLPRD